MDSPFSPHLTYEEAQNLKVGDEIDHRDYVGRFFRAKIVSKTNLKSTLRIHYIGWNKKWDCYCSYDQELHRFATANSISKRPAHRLTDLRIGDYLEANLRTRFVQCNGWQKAKLSKLDKQSGQIRVTYEHIDKMNAGKRCHPCYWTHLDNIDEVDRLGNHTKSQQSERLPIWLQTRHTLLSTPHHLLTQCGQEIIQNVFGGMSNLIDFIVQYGNSSQLQEIQNIVQHENIKYQELQKTVDPDENEELLSIDSTENVAKPKISSITELSKDMVSYICGFLVRRDVESLRLTSYRNCMICLKEMKKFSVGILNTNLMINATNKEYEDLVGFRKYHFLTYNRYISTTSYSYLCEEWKRMYDIPKKYQLFINIGRSKCTIYRPQDIEDLLICNWQREDRNFYLFDTRNIIIFGDNDDDKRPMIMKQDINNIDVNNKEIVVFKWYDIYFQKLMVLQFVMLNRENITCLRLMKYICNEFIATTKEQKIWHKKTLSYIENMSGNDEIIKMYKEKCNVDGSVYVEEVNSSNDEIDGDEANTLFVFSLNPLHPTMAGCRFANVKQKYSWI